MERTVFTTLTSTALLVLSSAAFAAENYGFTYSATDLNSASSTKTLLREIERKATQHCRDEDSGMRDACEDKVVDDIVGEIDNARLSKYASKKR